MATLYFTNNADSGDGSLRAAIANAVDGDVISPDPTVNWGNDVITISLSSLINITKSIDIVGGTKRIRIDGQGTTRCFSLANATIAFTDVDVVDGYANSSQAAGIYASNTTLTLTRCRICGNRTLYYGSGIYIISGSVLNITDCVVADNYTATSQTNSAALTCAANTTVNISRCTFSGNVYRDVRVIAPATVTVVDTLAQRVSGGTEIPFTYHTPSTAGFVAPPSDEVSASDWANSLWKQWDLRLGPTSAFLTGATGAASATDIYGHSRLANGSIGAFEGSWFVVHQNETKQISDYTAVDYAEINNGGTVVFNGVDKILTVKKNAKLATSSLSATAGSNGYVCAPVGTSYASISTTNVEKCYYGAHVLSFSAVRNNANITVQWTIEDATAPVRVEYKNSSNVWTKIGDLYSSPYSENYTNAREYRVIDGLWPLHYASVEAWATPTAASELTDSIVCGYITFKDAIGYLN